MNTFYKILGLTTFSIALLSGLTGCASTTQVGATGVNRSQLLLVSSEEVNAQALQSYNNLKSKAIAANALDKDPAMLARLTRIAQRIIPQVTVLRPDAKNWNWEVHTISSDELNAFVLPGGKIMFYTGIVKRLNLTDDEIAAIMGHEMSHALREHSREQMSQAMLGDLGMEVLAASGKVSQGGLQGIGIAKQLGLDLPFNRTQESEADVLGLELMARAGYNPEAAISLWHKMQAASQGEPPAFLSTHPSSSSRIEQIQAELPKVMPLYYAAIGKKK